MTECPMCYTDCGTYIHHSTCMDEFKNRIANSKCVRCDGPRTSEWRCDLCNEDSMFQFYPGGSA